MGSTYLSSPPKRKMSDPNPNGSSKRFKQQPLHSHVTFRLLCHESRVGGVIGKSGTVIKQLQQSTGAKIRVEDAPPESADRVITVTGPADVEGSGMEVSRAQDALVRVFERILEVAMESNGAAVGAGVVSCRLLTESGKVGSVIGKGGKIVEKIRKECGCKIRVLNDKLPSCAEPNDQVVEIEGDVVAVKKGLIAVSHRLKDSPAADKMRMVGPVETPPREILHRPLEVVPQESLTRYFEVVPQETLRRPLEVPQATLHGHHETVTQETLSNHRTDFLSLRNSVLSSVPSSFVSYGSGVNPLSLESDRFATVDSKPLQQEVTFKILCPIDMVGGVLGKGGGIIQNIQNETGASIAIGNTITGCDERLIVITASENPESQYSPAQKATVLCFSKATEAGLEKGIISGSNKGSPSVTARLAVPSNVVGCLLGKGGTIISEMRKITGTGIRITGGDQVPKCVSENEQLVQISGEFSNVKDAVYRVTARLRDQLFSTGSNSAGMRNSSSISTEASPYGRSLNPSSLGSAGFSHSVSRPSKLTQGMDQLGPSHGLDRQLGPSHGFDRQLGPSHGFDRQLEPSHCLDRQLRPSHGFDRQLEPSHCLDRQLGPSHGFDRQLEPSHYLDQPLGPSRRLDQPCGPYPGLDRSQSPPRLWESQSLGPSHGLDRPQSPPRLWSSQEHGPSHSFDRPQSPARLWASQTVGGVNSRDYTDIGRGVSSFKGGLELGSGCKSAFVTNTTVEIVVPENVIGCVYGENGNNLACLRQISGAKVIVHNPRYGSTNRIIVISGTPDETQAAQSLLQAFIFTGPS